MPHVHTITTYTYSELDDDAKARARDWYRDVEAQDCDLSSVLEDAAAVCLVLGVELKTHAVQLMNGKTRHDPNIWYSLSYSQGDGACFEGRYYYAKGAHRKIREHAPQDTELHRIADGLQEVQRRHGYSIWADLTHTGAYSHSRTVSIDVCDKWHEYTPIQPKEDETAIKEYLYDLMEWIYQQLQQEYDYRLSDAVIAETLEENEYAFTAEGRRSCVVA